MAVGTTYFCGNEDTSFTFAGTAVVTTNNQLFRQAWVRTAIEMGDGSTADPPPNRLTTPVFVGTASFWVHAQIAWPAPGGSADNNACLFRLLDSSGVARLMVRGAGSGAVKISTRDHTGALTDLVTSPNNSMPLSGLSPFPMDFQCVYSGTSSGYVAIWFNDVLVASYSGANTTDSATQLAQADFDNISTSQNIFWSEELISDTITINAGVFTLPPLAAGTTQNWAGVDADINKTSINDTTFISDGTTNDLSGWTTPISFPTGAWVIQSIVQGARAAVGVTGPQHFDWYVRVDSSGNVAGVMNAPELGVFSNFSNYIWANNPHTTNPWALTDITTGFNLGVKSLA
jgi:hypothetical protein